MDPVFPIQQHRRLARARAKVEALQSKLKLLAEETGVLFALPDHAGKQ
jgi:hypothetical protein